MPMVRTGFDKWKFIANTKKDLDGRILDIQEIYRENDEKIRKLQFENACLYFLVEQYKQNLRDWKEGY